MNFDINNFLGPGPSAPPTLAIPAPAPKPEPIAMPAPGVPTAGTVPEPGVYYDVPAHVYHKWLAVSSTMLKNYADLPSTSRDPFNPSDDVNVGSAVHAYVLQGDAGLQEECFILPPECEGKGEAAQRQRARYTEIYPHKALIPHRYGPGGVAKKIPIMEVLRGVNRSFLEHPKTGPILRNSRKEVSVVWIDPDTGLTCKARFDIWGNDRIIWDVKKTQDIDRFKFQFRDLHYDVQDGHYFSGAVAVGLNPIAFGFMPCEAVYPFRVTWGYRHPDRLLEDVHEAKRLLGLLKESILTDNWPNYRIPAHIYHLADITADDTGEDY